MSHKIMVIMGTRPEAVKLAPVIQALQCHTPELETCVLVTGQHRSMLDQVLGIFGIIPNHDLNIMQADQSLTDVTVRAMSGIDKVLQRESPDMIVVQGDTVTALAGAMAAFYRRIPVGHVEAGLRTGDMMNPFPEEMARCVVDILSSACYAPTSRAARELVLQNIPEKRVVVTGNTVIDALLYTARKKHNCCEPTLRNLSVKRETKLVLVTAHRRENLGEPMERICRAMRDLLRARNDVQILFPVHLNPSVRRTVNSFLADVPGALLIEPLDYEEFIHAMKLADLVVTDSGGIQEEAPVLGKPVLVMRSKTERPEAVEAGTAKLIGTKTADIVARIEALLDDPVEYASMQRSVSPFGDGRASARIVNDLRRRVGLPTEEIIPIGSPLALPKKTRAGAALR